MIIPQENFATIYSSILDSMIMNNLQTMLLDSYLYIGQYYYTYELIRDKPVDKQQEIKIRLCVNLQYDQQTHNLSTAEEIAVIIPEEGVYYAIDNRDVVLWARRCCIVHMVLIISKPSKCMVNGQCSKHFPKDYRERIDWAEDSYPLYARLDNSLVFEYNRTRYTN